MKLGHKLLIAPVVTALVMLVVGQIDSALLSKAASESTAGFEEHMGEYREVVEAQVKVDALHVDVYRTMTIIGSLDEAAVTAKRKEVSTAVQSLTEALQKQAANNDEGSPARVAIDSAVKDFGVYGKKVDTALDLASVDPNTGVAAMQDADTSYASLIKSLSAAGGALATHASEFAEKQTATAKQEHLILSVVSVLSAIVVVALSAALLRKIAGAINQASEAAQHVAGGELNMSINSARTDEIGDLLRALESMRNALLGTVRQVRQASEGIETASAEIAMGNRDLSSRTEQAASNLEETAASMEELTATVKQSADAARQANQLASSAAQTAQRGGDVVAQVVSTMNEINHSSQKISDIIGVIDGIAFQTNILALNAAVEAARAGEQGRGFAVVAGEVRSLAQRSAEAAKEIKGLIGTSVEKVENGSRLVGEAGTTMTEIVGAVQRVSDIIGEITAASGEQSDGIGQVNVAVSQLDQMTQQNAALVEESTAAAESLKDQARRLAEVIGFFRADGASAQVLEPVAAKAKPVKQAPAAVAQSTPARSAPALGAPRAASVSKAIAKPAAKTSASSTAVASGGGGDEGDWESF